VLGIVYINKHTHRKAKNETTGSNALSRFRFTGIISFYWYRQ